MFLVASLYACTLVLGMVLGVFFHWNNDQVFRGAGYGASAAVVQIFASVLTDECFPKPLPVKSIATISVIVTAGVWFIALLLGATGF